MKKLFGLILLATLAIPIANAGTLEEVQQVERDQGLHDINTLRVASAGAHDETVTVGDQVYQLSLDDTVTSGNVEVDIQGDGTRALSVLTLSGNAVADETVTIGSTVYTWKAEPSAAYEVDVGTDAATSIDNLYAAINASGTPGTEYGTGTLEHPDVSGTAEDATTLTVSADNDVAATVANALATTETMTNASWADTTLGGGTGASTPGVDATAGETSDALIAAINANDNSVVGAIDISANEVLLYHKDIGSFSLATTETLAGSDNAFAAAAMYGGDVSPDGIDSVVVQSRVANAQEAALDTFHFYLPFTASKVLLQVRETTGAVVAFDGTVVISGNRVTATGSGSTDIDATDIVTIIASD
jgi:hypothetical protein